MALRRVVRVVAGERGCPDVRRTRLRHGPASRLRRRGGRRRRARPRACPGPAHPRLPSRAAADLLHLHGDDAPATAARRALRPGRLRGRRRNDAARGPSTSSTSTRARCRSTATSATPGVWRSGSAGTATTSGCTTTTPGRRCRRRRTSFMGGGGQDSGQSRVEDDLAVIADRLRDLAADGTPMIMICGMYQLFGNAFITVEGQGLPGLGILDVTTRGNPTRMIGGIVLDDRARRGRRLREPFGRNGSRQRAVGASVPSAPVTATTAPTAPRAP